MAPPVTTDLEPDQSFYFRQSRTPDAEGDSSRPVQPVHAGEESIDDTFRVSLVQLDSLKSGNYLEMLNYALIAKMEDAELLVFPESSAFGWLNPIVFTDAHPIPGATSDQFSSIAIKANICVAAGIAERGPSIEGIYYQAYDSGILLNPKGKIVIHHRKNSVLKNAFNPDECPHQLV
jgi:N-carbamoylputrescine amidase